jgi:LPS sulfotransferase NodH
MNSIDKHPPDTSYMIWFSQRTGSTLLCQALKSTGIAGNPAEWLEDGSWQLAEDPVSYLRDLWRRGSTANGVFGLKLSFYEPFFSQILGFFKTLSWCKGENLTRAAVWEVAFPGCRHIFMTRRNKVRLAVSWWKAIQSGEWHRARGTGTAPNRCVPSDAYSFDAINQLLVESVFREAGIQAFFSEGGIRPLTLVYEDFIENYQGTLQRVLDFIGLDSREVEILPPSFEKMADSLSEEWVQRFRRERQRGWQNQGW